MGHYIGPWLQGWEFIKEKKGKKKTRTRPRKYAYVHQKKLAEENTHSTKKASTKKKISFKKRSTRTRKKEIFKLGEISINFTFNNIV